jgi:UDP-galactopyranose mutase
MKYDYLIVGTGLFGSVCAYELNKLGYKVLVIESRSHIGGNCYTEKRDGINIHLYGAHIFHTSNKRVWDWINQFVEFNNYRHTVLANYKNELYSLPFSMWTFSKMWNVNTPDEAKLMLKKKSDEIKDPTNLEEQAIKLVGIDVYTKLIKGYTAKQWRKDPKDLPKEIIKRLPVRFTYDNNYFNDTYQGIPIDGYTQLFEKLLEGIDVKLEVDYLEYQKQWDVQANHIIYTGAIDRYFGYKYGDLEYKTNEFKHVKENTDNYQGSSVVNYTDESVPYTRILEHKHFEFANTPSTWITYEYPAEYNRTEPMYPVNDEVNNSIYKQYKEEADKLPNYTFGGRLAEYKYYDMHQVIESALNTVDKIKKPQ